jgi:PTH1 family peptidyl-tRNA hydrolase
VVGLGNPGVEFVNTRHNVGAEVVAELAVRHQGRLKLEKGLFAQAALVTIAGHRVLLAVPVTYMNDSGQALVPLVRRAGIDLDGPPGGSDPEAGSALPVVVVHDELDLPSGRIKIKSGGGNAGHNGLKSVDSHLHTNSYLRVRVGIGKPPGRQPGADFVLKRPGLAERAVLEAAIEEAADAVEVLVAEGVGPAMTRFNAGA